ncbi:MAG: site-2 protease family protein [bacterium]
MPELAELRRIVEAHFRVYEAREQVHKGHVGARFFYVMVPPGEFDRRYDAVQAEMKAKHPELLTFVRREGGEDIIFVAERPPAPRLRVGLHLGLLLATVVTTALAGAIAWHGYSQPRDTNPAGFFTTASIAWGALTFAVPLMAILGAQAAFTFLAGRRRGMHPALPLFIPAPPIVLPFGTFGAFSVVKEPFADRKAMFDVGVAGPLAGFALAVPILILGMFLTSSGAHAVPDIGRPTAWIDQPFATDNRTTGQAALHLEHPVAGIAVWNVTGPGDAGGDWAYSAQATLHLANGTVLSDDLASHKLAAGKSERRTILIPANVTSADITLTWDDHFVRFGDPLLVILLQPLFPHDGDYLTHPLFLAGWVGLLIGSIKLLPIGQLDGGRVSRAILGDNSLWLARGVFAALVLLSFIVFDTWIFIAFFVFALGLQHPPPLNDRSKVEGRRLVVAAIAVAILVLTFIPVPIQV